MDQKEEIVDTPKFFNLLSEKDQLEYRELQKRFTMENSRTQRGKRAERFEQTINVIEKFCLRNNKEEDSKRCLVCGICWVPEVNGIAINTRQFSILVRKCKSSINGSLQRLNYTTVTARAEGTRSVVGCIPELKDNHAELREWTLRKKSSYQFSTPIPAYPIAYISPQPQHGSPSPMCYRLPQHPINATQSIGTPVVAPQNYYNTINSNSNTVSYSSGIANQEAPSVTVSNEQQKSDDINRGEEDSDYDPFEIRAEDYYQ